MLTIFHNLSERLQDVHLTLNKPKILTQSIYFPTLCDVNRKTGRFVTVENRVYLSFFRSVIVSSCLGNLYSSKALLV
jgi:hypothetical protein